MRTRFTWIVATLALVAIGFLLACSTKYSANSSTHALVVVPTQGTTEVPEATAVMETFSLNLANGQASQINNVNGPPTPGLPTAVILDPAGANAYVIVHQNAELVPSETGITVFPIGSDGKLGAGTTTTLNNTTGGIPVVPVALVMDSAGKFLFVADSATSGLPGSVSVLAVGTNGSLTEVSGSPFSLPVEPGGTTPSASALAVTPTAYPIQFSSCSGHTPPTTENLYVTDSVNYVLLNYSVDPSAGTLTLMPYSTSSPGIPTDQVPSGVAVDPCNQFVYVANALTNDVSAYTICSAINDLSTPPCLSADFSLNQIHGSPYHTNSNSPGPLAVDAYGKYLYVVNTGSSNITGYVINRSTGVLQQFIGQPAAAGLGANSIAIRSDDSWLFVANTNATTVSQYAITQSTGVLNPVGPINTFDLPSGVAVK
jgi:6-phosphogluconolactonase (cycloisomerase 2 family)